MITKTHYAHVNVNITDVRMAVAKSEWIFLTPVFVHIVVNAVNRVDCKA
jgi:hypothetical protein